MVVGIVSLRFVIPGSHSLKDKRRCLRGVKDRLRAQFNVSIAEVGEQDVWQTAVLGLSAVGTDRAYVEGLLDQAIQMVRRQRDVTLVSVEKEFV
ncbi:MAG: DUF503 domain-containing protein [Candidatus Brocadiia bacterium]|jgi:uncharacterized protein YlxP (DUF503 family)